MNILVKVSAAPNAMQDTQNPRVSHFGVVTSLIGVLLSYGFGPGSSGNLM